MGAKGSYTLCLFGQFNSNTFRYGYFDALADHYHENGGLNILIGLTSNKHLPLAERILDLKRIFSDLRLEVAVNLKQQGIFNRGSVSVEGQTRNHIMAAADVCHVMESKTPEAVSQEMLHYFASRSDKIVYASEGEMRYFQNHLRFLKHRPETEYFKPHIIIEPLRVRSAQLLARSIDFIRQRTGSQVILDEIPEELLSSWLADGRRFQHYFGRLDDTAELLRITDDEGYLLPLKVFAYLYCLQNDQWAFAFARHDEMQLLFEQFQATLRRVVVLKRSGRQVKLSNPLYTPSGNKGAGYAQLTEPSQKLAQSFEFIREKRFQVMSDELPDELLSMWLTDNERFFQKYFDRLDDMADLLRLQDDEGHLLPLKVFAYAYNFYKDFWAFEYPHCEEVSQRFDQFQGLLHKIAKVRNAGSHLRYLNIFDFPHYDSAIEFSEWADSFFNLQTT